jgi:uncharacterized protein YcnI
VKKVLGLALALVLLTAAPAYAHVTVNPSEVAEGSFAKLTFRVPNESDSVSTTQLEVVFPEAIPFASARTKPVPGWTAEIVMDGDRVASIIWTGGEIGPSEFQEFDISLGPIPEADVIQFGALQTYSDGEVVRWIDPVVDGEEEPEHPAPTLTIVEGDGEHGHDAGATDGEDDEDESGEEATAAADVDPDDDAENGTDTITFVALFVAGAALIAAVAALIMGRKRPPV